MTPNAASASPSIEHLHPEVGHVPPAVGDDVVQQRLEIRVERVDQLHLLVQVAAVDLDVAGLVDHLGGRVELGIDVGHGLHDLGCADQRPLLAVHELAEAPGLDVAAQLAPALVRHLLPPVGAEQRIHLVGHADRVGEVDLLAPVQPVAADPLAPCALVVETQQLVPSAGVVEVEHRGRRRLDAPLRLEGEVRVGGRRAGGHGAPLSRQRCERRSCNTRRYPLGCSASPGRGHPAPPPGRPRGAADGHPQRKSKATLMAPLCCWVASAMKASRQSSRRKVWVSMPVMSTLPCSARRR